MARENLRQKIAKYVGIGGVSLASLVGGGCMMQGKPSEIARDLPEVPFKFIEGMFGMPQQGEEKAQTENKAGESKEKIYWLINLDKDNGVVDARIVGLGWIDYIIAKGISDQFPEKGYLVAEEIGEGFTPLYTLTSKKRGNALIFEKNGEKWFDYVKDE